ncbi:hypothetical protein A4A49_09056 [Nicotiana attenuata]|uniref:Uncharacterized protein n=1 Tax=Nicotiana attenuata TaxID=49451 RepID=A0A314L4V5_NICAT|nr:hypothetical protein A4A49_09056 [Nicotiana attenuata]
MVKFADRCKFIIGGYDEDQDVNGDGKWLEVQIRDEEMKRRKEEEAAETSTTSNQKRSKDEAGTSKSQQRDKRALPKSNTDLRKSNMTAEHQKLAEHQKEVTEITEEVWQTQKKKKFKGTTQSKGKQQMYMPKQSTTHQYQPMPNAVQQHDSQTSSIAPINPPAQLERSVDSGSQNQPISPVPHSITISHVAMVEGGKENCQEKPIDRQEGVPNGVGLPHVLHECAIAQLVDHRMDLLTPATTLPTSATVLTQQPIVNEASDDLSSEEDPPDPLNDELRRLAKGKAHAASDFSVQPPKSKNKLSQKKRQAKRRQNVGICINEPSENPSDSPFQSPFASRRGNPDLGHANRSQGFTAKSRLNKDPDIDPTLTQPGDTQFVSPAVQQRFRHHPNATKESPIYMNSIIGNPSLSQPLLSNKEPTSDGNESDIPTNDENPTSKTHKATSVPTSTPRKNHHLHPLEMVLEEYPLNRYTPQQDEYRPIESEDEIIRNKMLTRILVMKILKRNNIVIS